MSGIEITRVDWHPQHAIAEVDHLASEAVSRAAELVKERAAAKVPYLTGRLQESAEISEHDGEVAVGYNDPVARYVHAHPEWNFQDGRSGRWLEETLDENAGEVDAIMTETMRAGWPRA